MKQIWIPRVGGPEVLELREAPDPEVGEGQLRIRVQAAGVNFADVLARMGLYPDAPKLPAVVGYEVSGTVDQVGAGVVDFHEGDRVLALTRFHGYSELVVVPHKQAAPIPGELGFEAAAAIPVNYLTAWIMLVALGNVRAGQRVLVHAVAGGVGQAALQICRWRGAEVLGTASPGKHPRLKELGATHLVDYRTKDFETEVLRLTYGHGVDLALDALGGPNFRKSYRCLAPLGLLFLFGVSSLAPGKRRSWLAALAGLLRMPRFAPLALMNENRGVVGVNLGHLWDRVDELRAMLGEILELVGAGTFEPVVDRSFPFEQAAAAHDHIQERRNFGKVLLVP